ncbi:MAG: SCO family protein [Chloroflexota bacterium]|nr:SCO family protein [Chloroflexota bacterium]
MKQKRKKAQAVFLLYSIIAGLLIGISALALFLFQDRLREPESDATSHFRLESETEFNGVIRIEPPIELPEFTLTSQDGDPTSLRDLRGQFVLLTFGFTNCPDICPLTLSEFQLVKGLLGDHSHEVAFVFISVDGSRDKPDVLRNFLDYRKLDEIIGLTGAEIDVQAAGEPLGLSFERSGETSPGSYSVNHSAGSFLLDRRGRWIMRYQFGLPPETIAADIQAIITQARETVKN